MKKKLPFFPGCRAGDALGKINDKNEIAQHEDWLC